LAKLADFGYSSVQKCDKNHLVNAMNFAFTVLFFILEKKLPASLYNLWGIGELLKVLLEL